MKFSCRLGWASVGTPLLPLLEAEVFESLSLNIDPSFDGGGGSYGYYGAGQTSSASYGQYGT